MAEVLLPHGQLSPIGLSAHRWDRGSRRRLSLPAPCPQLPFQPVHLEANFPGHVTAHHGEMLIVWGVVPVVRSGEIFEVPLDAPGVCHGRAQVGPKLALWL